MTEGGTRRYDKVQFLDAAIEDMRRLAERSRPLLLEVFRKLKRLAAGQESPQRLHDFAKTGDLQDCGKILVVVEGEPEYRIVVRDLGGHFEVCEVVAVEDRTEDLPYLLAGLRLGRIADPIRRSDVQRRIARLRRLREQ